MGEIVNLRRVRKSKARDTDAIQAAENRRLSGRTKSERKADKAQQQALDRILDSAKITRE